MTDVVTLILLSLGLACAAVLYEKRASEKTAGVVEVKQRWELYVLEKFATLLKLKLNFDSYGSKRVCSFLFSPAWSFLCSVMHTDSALPDIIPCNDGGIAIEWHINGHDVEIEFTPDGPIHWRLDKGEHTSFGDVDEGTYFDWDWDQNREILLEIRKAIRAPQ